MYYREMRKFIALPQTFKGVGDSTIFGAMIDRNPRSIVSVYRKVCCVVRRGDLLWFLLTIELYCNAGGEYLCAVAATDRGAEALGDSGNRRLGKSGGRGTLSGTCVRVACVAPGVVL